MTTQYSRERGNPKVPACTFPVGSKTEFITLTFTGAVLQFRTPSGTKTYPAVSGGTAKKFEAIPPGLYWIQPAELWSRGSYSNAKLCIAGLLVDLTCQEHIDKHAGAWGDYRITIHPYPKTKVGNRGGFFIHGGSSFGSAGCIDLAAGMNTFVADLKAALGKYPANCYIDLTVK